MLAITLPTFGGPEVLTPGEVPTPDPGPGEVRIKVAAAGVNRADLLQRRGFYPPPPGESEIPGLEVSGVIDAVGDGVIGWGPGDPVCALLAGGGYAQSVVVPSGQVLPIPDGVSLIDAAGLPEVTCTVWSNLVMTAGLAAGERLLVHGGASGIGTMAIQVATRLGARVAVTVGTDVKAGICRDLGADVAINYRDADFVEAIQKATSGSGADVILDVMGASYLARNVAALAVGGRLVIIGMQGGVKAELNLAALLGKRGAVFATSLRSRPREEKAAIVAQVREHVWPDLASGAIRPIIFATRPLAEAGAAHDLLDAGDHVGKVLLVVDDSFG